MTRDEITDKILQIPNKNILCELATGVGKSKIAIEICKSRNVKTLLLVVPRNVLKTNWQDEFLKWYPNNNWDITYTTYASLHKYAGNYDVVIYDECHHLSERCRELVPSIKASNNILLSATVKRDLKYELKKLFSGLYCYNVSAKEAIFNDILPDPKVYLIPLSLDNTKLTESIIINPKAPNCTTIDYKDIWKARKIKGTKFIVKCTERQYYNEISDAIEWYKKKAMGGNQVLKNIWLRKCGERLKWLSDKKLRYVMEILLKTSKHRTLTFCSTIEQTELLGEYCINSKNKDSIKYLNMFNSGKINHITAVNMLNEGMNLNNCKVGIYANLNSSEVIVAQRLGRLLRHKEPIIIIPYFVNTREEELKDKMLENYNPSLINTTTIKEL